MVVFYFLKLIRPVNLFIIVLTMYLVRRFLVIPIFVISTHINPDLRLMSMLHLHRFDFFLLVLSAVLIGAAGNIINDYFDRRIDEINKPEKVIIGKKISVKHALFMYWSFNVIGLLLSAYCAWRSGVMLVLFVNLFAATSLWFYSWQYKKSFLLGNLLVAFLSAGITVLAALAEPEFYINFRYVLVYTAFAFLLSLIREIVKDMEDIEGDRMEGCRTMPLVIGLGWSRTIVISLVLVLGSFITYVLYKNFLTNTVLKFSYMLLFAMLPFAGLIYLLISSKGKDEFHFASTYIKVLMLFGILTILPFYYFFMS